MDSSEDEPLLSEEIDVNNAIRAIREFIHPDHSGLTGTIVRRFIGRRAVDKLMRIYQILYKFRQKHPRDKLVTAYLYK